MSLIKKSLLHFSEAALLYPFLHSGCREEGNNALLSSVHAAPGAGEPINHLMIVLKYYMFWKNTRYMEENTES